jgi:glycosyltransferase involved in cell wall biosynthesis
MAKVDVIVTCYNYGRFLEQCVRSVLAQQGVDVSVVVVDDASTDHSAELASELARQDSRVRLISLAKNIGVIRAVNLGLQEITAPYVVKLDADDLLTSGSLERSVKLLERYPNVGFAYGRPHHFTGAVPRLRVGHARWNIFSGAEWFALRCRTGVNCISQPEVMIRSSTLRKVGEFNIRLPHTYDFEMWLRLSAISEVGRINGVDQGYYRVHPDSMQRTVNAGPLIDLVGRRDAFLSALSAGEKLRDRIGLEAIVREKLAREALDRACRAHDRDRVESALEDKLIEFAITTFSSADMLPEWHRLQRRRQRGRRSRWAPGSLMAALSRRSRDQIAYLRWIRTGL